MQSNNRAGIGCTMKTDILIALVLIAGILGIALLLEHKTPAGVDDGIENDDEELQGYWLNGDGARP